MWSVEFTNEFGLWWESFTAAEQEAIDASVRVLELRGPYLGRPHADTVANSRHSNMKELRIQFAGRPYRIFFAFDPRRSAILLVGGNKAGKDDFYKRMIPVADDLYDQYLQEIEDEGLI